MNNSRRGPQRGNGGPFIMHLERVCQLIDMGARFGCIEFNPCSDLTEIRDTLIKDVGLKILGGGEVALVMLDGSAISGYGLRLGNYKRLWRMWQNGIPSIERRRATKWG